MAARILQIEANEGFTSRSDGAHASEWNNALNKLRALVMEKPELELDPKMVRSGNEKSWGIRF